MAELAPRWAAVRGRMLALCCVFYAGMIFSFSLRPGEESAGQSGAVLALLAQLAQACGLPFSLEEWMVRKAAHFLEFFGYGALLAWSFPGKWPPGAALLTACCDEALQLLVPGRSGQAADALLDFCGACAGILCARLARRAKRV